ncbi:MAG: hypothetical protein A2136_00795 [Chloroflexi bacterium RBG_16_54_11]|nr:MAG: hypothetical protein A2136_00795 [Chloroflexi bacterium RBG_16_54_11]
MKMKRFSLIFIAASSLLLVACATSGSGGEPTIVPGNDAETAVLPTEPSGLSETAEPETPSTPETSDFPIFEGAVDYKSTGDGTYISYNVPDTTVEIVSKFYLEQLAAQGWEQKNKQDTGFGGSITIVRSKPDTTISVTIDTNAVNNGVRVLITLIPK